MDRRAWLPIAAPLAVILVGAVVAILQGKEPALVIGAASVLVAVVAWTVNRIWPHEAVSRGRLRIGNPRISDDGHFDFNIHNEGQADVTVQELRVEPYTPSKPSSPILPRLIDVTGLTLDDPTPTSDPSQKKPVVEAGHTPRFRTENPLYESTPGTQFYRIVVEDANGNESVTTVGYWGNAIRQDFPWPPDFGPDPMTDEE